jgi:hypothetical protein
MSIEELDVDTVKLVFYVIVTLLLMGVIDFMIMCKKLDYEFCDDKDDCTFFRKVQCFFKHRLGIKHSD